MKKYLQIGIVVIIFFAVVFVRSTLGKTEQETPAIQPLPTPSPDNQTSSRSVSSSNNGQYKDGTYTGNTTDAVYGPMQVQATIQSGKITDIKFLQYPNDNPTTLSINQQAMPILKSEAIQGQNSNVDIVSTASQSSAAFKESLASALAKATK